MKVYKDKALTKEITAKTLELGIVPAGESRKFEFYIHNNTKAWIRELQFKVEHAEVRVMDAPTELESAQTGVLVLEWSPSVTLKEGLRAGISVEGIELWRG